MIEKPEELDSSKEEVSSGDDGVKVPEEFQKQVYALVSSCTNEEMVDYIQDCCQSKQMEMVKSSSENKPEEYSDEDMPKD